MEYCWLFLVIAVVTAEPQNNRNDGPRFLSRGHSFRTVVGDTLLLPCQVQNLGSLVLLWRRGPAVLTAASLMVTRDERFRLVDGYNLQITDVGPQDAGDYVCQISDRVARDQVHTVEVLVPPSVRAAPESRHAAARRGGAAVLECRAAGNPVPTVVWHKLNDTSTRIGEGPQLQLSRLERQHSGVYACTVDNGVGSPIVTQFTLQVLYPPEIAVERSWVHSGEGFRAELLCTVLADPPAEVTWYQNSFPLSASERVTMSARGNNHTLLIANVQPEDFGNYSCVADNSLGRARQHAEVSGRPGPARFTSAPAAAGARSYRLAFVVDSYPPLEELRLLYRQLAINESFQSAGRWHDVALPAPAPGGSLAHRVSHELTGLAPAAVYEAIVQAKNRYGWNEMMTYGAETTLTVGLFHRFKVAQRAMEGAMLGVSLMDHMRNEAIRQRTKVSDIFQFHTLGGAHSAHADELTPMFSSTSTLRLRIPTVTLALYTLLLLGL